MSRSGDPMTTRHRTTLGVRAAFTALAGLVVAGVIDAVAPRPWDAAPPAAFAAEAAPVPVLPWAHGIAAGQAEAKARNVPFLVILVLEGEPGNEAMLADVHSLPAVREAMKKCVVTIASIQRHTGVPDAAGRSVCSRFGGVTCDEHCGAEETIRRDWLKKGPKDDIFCPRHIFRGPDGRLLFERVETLDAVELVKLIERAVAYSTPESLASWDTIPARLKRASDLARCVRLTALADLLAPKDPAIDAQVFDVIRKCEIGEIAEDLIGGVARAMTPTRADGLRKLLAAPSPKTRMQAAAGVLRDKGTATWDALAAAAAKEKRADVLGVFLRALPLAGGDAAKTRDLLLKFAKSGDAESRAHAITALAQWAAEDAVVEAVRKLPTNEKAPESVRMAAAWLVGLSGRKDLAADLKPLEEERSDNLKRVGAAAARRLGGEDDAGYHQMTWWFAPLAVGLR